MAGWSYITKCSPNNIIFAGADAIVILKVKQKLLPHMQLLYSYYLT
jgi:hypothetical protein